MAQIPRAISATTADDDDARDGESYESIDAIG